MESNQKRVVITGGSSGIGRSTAALLHSSGYQIINADKDAPPNSALIRHVPCDITVREDIESLYQTVISEFGVPDVLISNAGIGIHEKLTEGDPEKWARVIDTNVMGALRFMRAFVSEMLERQTGHIIFITSVAAGKAYPYGGVYGASKAAVEIIAETLRLEVQPHLKVSVVAPGAIDTSSNNTINAPRDYSEIDWQHVSPEEVGGYIRHILSLPDEVNIDYSVVRPRDQPF